MSPVGEESRGDGNRRKRFTPCFQGRPESRKQAILFKGSRAAKAEGRRGKLPGRGARKGARERGYHTQEEEKYSKCSCLENKIRVKFFSGNS